MNNNNINNMNINSNMMINNNINNNINLNNNNNNNMTSMNIGNNTNNVINPNTNTITGIHKRENTSSPPTFQNSGPGSPSPHLQVILNFFFYHSYALTFAFFSVDIICYTASQCLTILYV